MFVDLSPLRPLKIKNSVAVSRFNLTPAMDQRAPPFNPATGAYPQLRFISETKGLSAKANFSVIEPMKSFLREETKCLDPQHAISIEAGLAQDIGDKAVRKQENATSNVLPQWLRLDSKYTHAKNAKKSISSGGKEPGDLFERQLHSNCHILEAGEAKRAAIITSRTSLKVCLRAEAKEFKPADVNGPYVSNHSGSGRNQTHPYFITSSSYRLGSNLHDMETDRLEPTLYVPYLNAGEKMPKAHAGYWIMDSTQETIIPGLDCYSPKDLEKSGVIIPVPWLPVD